MKNSYGVKAFLAISIMLCGQILAAAQTIETEKRSVGADPTWSSLIVAPPYPTYAGNMAAIGTSQSTVLSMFFGRDDIRFSHTWEGAGGATRSYPGFATMANEQERARVWGGLHFAFDNVAGQSIGRNVGAYVFQNIMQPRRGVQ